MLFFPIYYIDANVLILIHNSCQDSPLNYPEPYHA